jgi:RNA polymerase sigma factor (sigma-70 family)
MTMPRGHTRAGGEPAGSAAFGLSGLDDRALIAMVSEGDGRALEVLYSRYGKACYSLARRILVDEQYAQDCVQEVFLTIWRDCSKFDPAKGGFASWLLSMTHHKAVDAVRREETVRKRRAAPEALEETVSTLDVDEEVWSSLRGERVRAALQALPQVQREALTLAYFGGYTQREIAGLTDTPLGTVKTRMLAGMQRMRSGLDSLSRAASARELDDIQRGLTGGLQEGDAS